MNPFAKQAALAERLEPGAFRSIRWVEACGSTNTELANEARASLNEAVLGARSAELGGAGSAVLVADRQTAGRGRLGRVWESPVGTALTMSMRLPFPGVGHSLAGLVPLAVGLAALRTVVGLGVQPDRVELKWPNDLMDPATGRKIAGILCESVDRSVVMGVGINLRRPPDLEPSRGSDSESDAGGVLATRAQWVDQIGAVDPDPVEAAALLANHTASLIKQLTEDAGSVIVQIRDRCATIGRHVRIEQHRESFTGVAVEIANDGALIVRRDDDHKHHSVHAADVVHLRPAG